MPAEFELSRAEVTAAAKFFAEKSSKRIDRRFHEISVFLQYDEESAETHGVINGVKGATDVITQPYDAIPGEPKGVYGELFVNVDQASRVAGEIGGDWTPMKELLLYIAHGMDHLSGADDATERGHDLMRKRELGWLDDFEVERRKKAAKKKR